MSAEQTKQSQIFSIHSEQNFPINGKETPRFVIHDVRPVVNRISIVERTHIPTDTFELLAANKRLSESEVSSAKYDTGMVIVQWDEPKIVDHDDKKNTVSAPRGAIRPILIGELQKTYPAICSEWTETAAVGDIKGVNYQQPSDIELVRAVLGKYKPSMVVKQ